MAIAKPDGETFHPTLILVGTRLGIDKINQVYWESLTATLQLPQSVGIAGYAATPPCLREGVPSLTSILTQRPPVTVTLLRRGAAGRRQFRARVLPFLPRSALHQACLALPRGR